MLKVLVDANTVPMHNTDRVNICNEAYTRQLRAAPHLVLQLDRLNCSAPDTMLATSCAGNSCRSCTRTRRLG